MNKRKQKMCVSMLGICQICTSSRLREDRYIGMTKQINIIIHKYSREWNGNHNPSRCELGIETVVVLGKKSEINKGRTRHFYDKI